MSLAIYNYDQSAEWDEIVRTFAGYDVYYLSGYSHAFSVHGDGAPLLFYYEGNGIRGMNVVMQRDISNDVRFCESLRKHTCFDFSTPYGYGGWLIEGSGDLSGLFSSYDDWCKEHNVVSEFVRFHPVLNNQARSIEYYDIVPLGGTVAMDLASPETVWGNLSSKNRNMIRKAQKNGIVIKRGRDPGIFERFREIYNSTMDRDNAERYYYFGRGFYDSVYSDLENEAQVFYAVMPDNTIIGASIILGANGRLNYHLSGSVKAYQHLAPMNLLLYDAALWGNKHGYKTLHLGGGIGSQEDGLYKFKKAFNRLDDCRFCIGKKIILADKYDELCEIRKTTDEEYCRSTSFFPKYRG